MELLDPCTTTTEARVPGACALHREATTVRSLCTIMKTQDSQKIKKKKKKKTLSHWLEHRSWGEGKLETHGGRGLGLSHGGPGGWGA